MSEKLTVLIVEDDPLDQQAFKRFVARQNLPYDYTVASSVSEALRLLAQEHFDIVLCDYRLGDGTAMDILPNVTSIPFIVITGSGNETVAVNAMKAGAYDYLMKDPHGDYLTTLPVTVERAIEHKHIEMEVERYRTHLEELVQERTTELDLGLERERRLNSMLRAIRNVNQIITTGKDRERLIRQSCDLMVKARGYPYGWILLFDEKRRYISTAAAGAKETQAFSRQREQGNYPPCIDRILAHKDSLAFCSDIVENGLSCLPRNTFGEGRGLISRLEHGGKVYGVMSVYVTPGYALDPEQQSLFGEMAGDIALALYSIEKEKEGKEAEEALQETKSMLDTVLNNAPVTIFATDRHGVFTMSDGKGLERVGLKPGENVGVSAIDLYGSFPFVKETGETMPGKDVIHRALAGETLVVYSELRGVNFVNRIAPMRDAKGEVIGIVGVATDITEHKRVEEQIRLAAEEWRATFDSITDMVSIHDKDCRIVRVNRAFADAFKMPPNGILGKHCYELMHGTAGPIENCPLRVTTEKGEPALLEMFEPNLGIWIQISTSPLLGANGEIKGVVHIVRDTSAQKKMQEQLMVNDRLASLGQLVSGIAHEINNPLTSVIGFSELLVKMTDLPEDTKAYLKIINDEAVRTADVVKGLLTFARRQKAGKEPLNLNSIIQNVLQLLTYEHKVSNVEVITQFAQGVPEVLGNSGQLQQVFINLIINATQAMLEAHNRGTMTIVTEWVGDNVRASVADDGPGISPENMRGLFTPFFTTKEIGKGTGLGLSICHGIVSEHGGKIYAESKPGRGATFVVELPANKQSAGK